MTLSKDQIKTSFWEHRPEANFPPPAVNYPGDYVRGSKLNLICTQLDLSSYQQKKLVNKWCQLLRCPLCVICGSARGPTKPCSRLPAKSPP